MDVSIQDLDAEGGERGTEDRVAVPFILMKTIDM
jgi:hypothetical protein